MIWGNKFSIKNGEVGFEKPIFGGVGYKDCSYIDIQVNLDNETIRINEHAIAKNEWKFNKNLVEDVIAQAYLNPRVECSDDYSPPPQFTPGTGVGTF